MFPFWHDVVAPVIEAAQARRVVEIGALRGDQTELMLERLGPDVELHVIDPVPFFDPAEHERRFAGRYVFHRALSVDVLGGLPPMDVALIDGDHNWYTVFTELNLLTDVARRAGAPMPVMVLHDVGWPYGRRDLYYDPSNIPAAHRQPWRRAGIRRGERRLVGGGLNSNLANAEIEGGARNGVMTAVDDFVAARSEALRLVVLPILFGLAVVVSEDRLAAQPALAAELDRLESVAGRDMLLRLGEDFRVDSLVLDHALLEQTTERAEGLASRYLETVKRSLRREASVGAPADDDRRSRHGEDDSGIRTRLDHLQACLDTVWAAWVRGDIAVTGAGVGVGASATFAAAYLEARDHGARHQVLIAAPPTSDGVAAIKHAREMLDRFDLLGERVRFLPGDAPATPVDLGSSRLAAIHLGAGAALHDALDLLYPRLVPGGIVILDDLLDPATCREVEAYRAGRGVDTRLERSDGGHAHWRVPARVTSDP